MISELVTTRHLSRKAVVYIRQSHPHQVLSNQESLRLQYALRQRACDLGWREADVESMLAGFGHNAGVHFLPDDQPAVDRALVAGRTLVESGEYSGVPSEDAQERMIAAAKARGIGESDIVRVFNDRGSFVVLARVSDEVAPGVARVMEAETILVSILAGAEVATLRRHFPGVAAIVRAMPNLPVSVRRGVTALYSEDADGATREQIASQIASAFVDGARHLAEGLAWTATRLQGAGGAVVGAGAIADGVVGRRRVARWRGRAASARAAINARIKVTATFIVRPPMRRDS